MKGGGSGLVVRPVFKTATEVPSAAPVGSIPTRSRHLPSPVSPAASRPHVTRSRCPLLLALLLGVAPVARAQDAPPADTVVAVADTLVRPIGPMGAFWRSVLIPGWGQARLNRKLTGGIFVAWEGVTLGMSLKTRHELAYLRRNGSERADNKRREHEDWIVLLAFNHLFAGLEAYVSAHLADFPDDLRLQAVPGGVGATMSVPFRLR